jgi:hypothetical protein
MIGLVHGVAGATCGALLRRRGPAVVAALISHMALDAIKHEEPMHETGSVRLDVLALDGALLGLAWLAVRAQHGTFSPQSLGAVAACLPDLDYFLLGSRVHSPFPHGLWPTRKIKLSWQFRVGVAAWLALLYTASASWRTSRSASERSFTESMGRQ